MTQTTFQTGQVISGYKVTNVSRIDTINSTMIQLTHLKTAARHIHIANEDRENTFGVFFRTVPEDSTGVAHILEHTVLCGSRNFEVRDPFFSMIKRSLSTFMNAFTASDWTMYPFSTQNEKDYYNLMDVYLDAAFFPKIDRLSFKQEGHRMEFVDSEDGSRVLEYKGVVYNEMKGAMSSPGQVMGRSLLAALYPETTYRNNSGGEPENIPDLTWENLKKFHAKYYHPSNSFFYTYGNLPLKQTLSVIENKVLNEFDFLQVDSQVASQPRWNAPKQATQAYAYADPQDIDKKYQACLAWLICDIKDSFEVLVMNVLEQILIGNSASPLRKALIESNLGSALSDSSGFDADNRDTLFSCGLKDIYKTDVPKVEKIICDTLTSLADKGIDPELIESAVHQIEFHRKEITNTPYPFGIKLLLSFAGTVIHEGDPLSCINIDDDLDRLKEEIDNGGFLEACLKKFFLDNPHRVLFTLEPDPELETRKNKTTREKLDALLKKLDSGEIKTIEEDAKALQKLQEEEEDVSVLPTLELEDVPPEIEIIKPDALKNLKRSTAYDRATSDILYFTCPVGAGDIDPSLFPLIPFFCQAFTGSGTKDHTYSEMAQKIDLYTGGISCSPFSGSYFTEEAQAHSFIALQGKALERNTDHLFAMISEFISKYSFTDFDRLKNLLFQYRSGLEASIVSTGHRYAISLSAQSLTKGSFINEMWHGIAQYQTIKQITENLKDENQSKKTLEALSGNLKQIARAIFRQGNIKPALIGSKDAILKADQQVESIHTSLPANGSPSFATPQIDAPQDIPFSGWHTNTSVSFVGQSFKAVRITHEDAPGLAVISKLLRSLYLHREIREKGGAYGGFAIYNSEEGLFSFGSYRDPHIKRTLDVYENACDFMISGEYSQTDVKEAILQVCSEIDKPETPGPAAMKAFYRNITKLSDDIRKNFKDKLLQLDKNQIQRIAEKYFSVDKTRKGSAVISSKERLEQTNEKLSKENRRLDLFKI